MNTELERRELLRGAWTLPRDVRLVPVEELSANVRSDVGAQPGDFAVVRPGFRSLPRVVDSDTVALLEQFRTARPLAEGVVRFARTRGLDPEEVLRHAFPVLQTFTSALLLVPDGSEYASAIEVSFPPGQMVLGYEIVQNVQALQDTEVYLARDRHGGSIALKIARPGAVEVARAMLAREAAILDHLGGSVAPALVATEMDGTSPFLATAWVQGVSVTTRTREIRLEGGTDWRAQLHGVAVRLADAYADLHRQGVVHGDAHPRNVLIDKFDRVWLLDFGLGRLLLPGSANEDGQRAGFGWHTEPEAVATVSGRRRGAPADRAGEQYSVASMIYTAICGEHYAGSSPRRDELVKRVIGSPPLPFSRHGFESWPEVEAVLARALAKNPAHRFPSTTEFARELRAAAPGRPGRAAPPRCHSTVKERLREEILALAIDPASRMDVLFPSRPAASAWFGAAGLAYFLYRASVLHGSIELLSAADHWSRTALAAAADEAAFDAPEVGVGRDRVASASLYHRAVGVHVIHGLVSHARGASPELEATVDRLQRAFGSNEPVEVALGRSGLLLGALLLAEPARSTRLIDLRPLERALAVETDRVWTDISQGIQEDELARHLGSAHGLSGVLYAQLRVHDFLGISLPDDLVARLTQLADLGEPSRRGRSWPRTLRGASGGETNPEHAPGWCGGSAGFIHLWISAHKALGNDRWRSLAEEAAWHAWEHPGADGHLCCGLAGRAWGLLHLYRYTGETAWLDRAEALVRRADGWLADRGWSAGRQLSLFRGALGPLLVTMELERPELATMPLFGSEGWTGKSEVGGEVERAEDLGAGAPANG